MSKIQGKLHFYVRQSFIYHMQYLYNFLSKKYIGQLLGDLINITLREKNQLGSTEMDFLYSPVAACK